MKPARRILIVDDEPNARTALSELLRDEGYDVSSAADSHSARQRMAELHPDLLLTDLNLHGSDGLELQAAARAMSDGPSVVLMSARPRPEDAHAPFVAKPIEIEKLLETIEETLAARPRWRST